MGNILVKIVQTNEFVGFKTISRMDGCNGRFLVFRDRLSEWFNNKSGKFIDTDCGHFAEFYKNSQKETVCCTFTWLSDYSFNVVGKRQYLEIPYSVIQRAIDGESLKFLCKNSPYATIDCSNAGRSIRLALLNNLSRNALRKAMRDNFKWRDEKVKLYCDGGCNFYFQSSDGLCGGLIMHDAIRNGNDGMPRKTLYYGIHT